MTTIQSEERAGGKNHKLIEAIKNEFEDGASLIEIQCNNPGTYRDLLYKATRRRGLLWSFAVGDKSLFIKPL